MKVVAVVQARLSSSRLPAKVLLDLAGKPALERCLRRVSRFRRVDEVVVATSGQPADDVIAAASRRLGYRVVRGSETDVLSRYVLAAKETDADVLVRCTSDCPLLDPVLSSQVIDRFLSGDADYAANTIDRRLPRGLDTEAFSVDALMRAEQLAAAREEREHVTLHMYRHPAVYRLISVEVPTHREDWSSLRWTLDTLDDYRFLYEVFDLLAERADIAGIEEVLALLAREPRLMLLNSHVVQKSTN